MLSPKKGVSNIKTVKSSNLPNSIRKAHHHLPSAGKLLKFSNGLKLPKAGPTLPREEAAPPTADKIKSHHSQYQCTNNKKKHVKNEKS